MRDLNHLLKPQSVAVIGGGAWCEQVVVQLDRFGFTFCLPTRTYDECHCMPNLSSTRTCQLEKPRRAIPSLRLL